MPLPVIAIDANCAASSEYDHVACWFRQQQRGSNGFAVSSVFKKQWEAMEKPPRFPCRKSEGGCNQIFYFSIIFFSFSRILSVSIISDSMHLIFEMVNSAFNTIKINTFTLINCYLTIFSPYLQ